MPPSLNQHTDFAICTHTSLFLVCHLRHSTYHHRIDHTCFYVHKKITLKPLTILFNSWVSHWALSSCFTHCCCVHRLKLYTIFIWRHCIWYFTYAYIKCWIYYLKWKLHCIPITPATCTALQFVQLSAVVPFPTHRWLHCSFFGLFLLLSFPKAVGNTTLSFISYRNIKRWSWSPHCWYISPSSSSYPPQFHSNSLNNLQEPTLYLIKGIVILDNDGNRILAKVSYTSSPREAAYRQASGVNNFVFCFVDKLQYYDDTFSSVKEQKAFERNLFNKTHRANAEVIMLDGMTCIYRNSVDLFFYVMGSSNENGVRNFLFPLSYLKS